MRTYGLYSVRSCWELDSWLRVQGLGSRTLPGRGQLPRCGTVSSRKMSLAVSLVLEPRARPLPRASKLVECRCWNKQYSKASPCSHYATILVASSSPTAQLKLVTLDPKCYSLSQTFKGVPGVLFGRYAMDKYGTEDLLSSGFRVSTNIPCSTRFQFLFELFKVRGSGCRVWAYTVLQAMFGR